MAEETKTIIFEKKYGVSIDDFEDTKKIDAFIESKIGRPLAVKKRQTALTARGGNVFRVSNKSSESIDASFSKSADNMIAQIERLSQS